ncbi:MAG: nucleotidyltransferase domain-containing protein [Anaerolineales bacterium]|nr:nucleotidyltransferase domain-containing protein [Anaerolineales bacterium]
MSSVDWPRLEQVLAAAPNVMAAWVFGSAQTGQIRAGSDLDIGVLFDSTLPFDEQLRLLGDLQPVVPFAEIDLVPLNEANPILRFEAVSGRAIFCRDASRRAEFVSLTAREYEDEMAMVERWVRAG